MSRNKKRCGGSVQSNPTDEKVEMSLTTGRHINSLPVEIILKIFSNLSHGDQLWARLVCRRWNEIITTDPQFLEKFVVRVFVGTNNRDIILKNSVVKWRNLYLKDLKSSGQSLSIIIPLHLRKGVRTAKISHAELTWKEFQQILIQFPSLRRLKISRSEITAASRTHWKLTHSKLESECETIMRGLSSIALSRLDRGTMNLFTHRFAAIRPVLATFKLKYDCLWVPDMLFELIESASPTLQKLCITILFRDPYRARTEFVREVIQRLNESEIAKTSLNLDTFSLSYRGPYLDYSARDLRTLLDFHKMNKNLKRVCGFPENNSSLTKELAHFEAKFRPTVHVFENIRSAVSEFPNLVAFKTRITAGLDSTEILQDICRHMNLLVSLDLTFEESSEVTDSGVTGISIPHCVFLRRLPFESLLSRKDDPIHDEHVTGFPLCSLRRLEKLTIRARRMNISNIGLCFGFRFPGLKKLSLAKTGFGVTRNIQITPEGLGFIADYNRSLEEVSLHNIVKVNSDDVVGSEAVQTFRNRMDRCKSFRMKITNSSI